MGVTGLWRLIEPAGKPVPIESLENKVLAVDISIWLHQVVKGYQDAKGAPLPNAHLMGLFQRLCKLLYFRIKPVFVFDGGFPELKKETIAKRQDNKTKYNSESERLKREIALLLGKKSALGSLLGTQISPKKSKNNQIQCNTEDIFKLPALPEKEEESETDSEDEHDSSTSTIDLHSVDIESENFKSMPVKEKYDLLVELKDTRKMNSWGKLHTLPKKSDNFSDFQMQRLLKRRKVQECLEETEKEMGDIGMSLNELESFLNEEGIDTKIENLPTRRIASNNTTRFLLINNVQQALANAKKREEAESSTAKIESLTEEVASSTAKIESLTEEPESSMAKIESLTDTHEELEEDLEKAIKMSLECEGEPSCVKDKPKLNSKHELDEDLEKAIKMSLECVEEANTSASKTDDSWTSYKSETDCLNTDSDSEEGDGYLQPDFSTAKAYIMQYSDFTYNAIDNIVASKTKSSDKMKKKCQSANEIIEELNHEKSVIVDKVDLSSDEEERIQTIYTGKASDTSLIAETQSQLRGNNHKNNENINLKGHKSLEKRIDSSVDMDVTQAAEVSVVCIEKPGELIELDMSSDETSEMKDDSTKATASRCISKNQLNTTDNNSEDDDDDGDFEEVSESIESTVQVTLDIPDTIENDIFADVFNEKLSNSNLTDQTLNNKEALIPLKTEAVIENITKLPTEIKCDTVKTYDIVTEVTSSVSIESETNSGKRDTTDNTTKPCDNDLAVSDTNVGNDQRTKVTKSFNEPANFISKDNLNSMVAEIEIEEQNLLQEKGKMERVGRNITEQMTRDAQELLKIFGIPYIVAPMEAEAQCAFLESINLTDGTITDDSDIWLFGGRTVYKNFFNQKKHVLQFVSERIEKSFNLSREQLILLALLVGSDYTTGVPGVGPVTALEILASFPFNKRQLHKEDSKHGQYQLMVTGLQEFKTWVSAGRRTDNISLKKKLKNVKLGDDFPSVRVVQAYLDPNVEKSKDKFSWGELDITILRDYTKAKFGWSQNKLDVILQPVIKRMLERKTQKSVKDYFKRKIDFQSLEHQMSKRVKAAVQKMEPENENKDIIAPQESTVESKLKAGQKRKRKINKQNEPSTSASETKSKKEVVEHTKQCTTEGSIEINIVKTHRHQEIIPQREKDLQNILQNKLKAIEIFRKTKIDRKRKPIKKRVNLPKDKAELSESSDSN